MQKKSRSEKIKEELIKYLGYPAWVPRKMMIPSLFYKKIQILYDTILKSSVTITTFISFMFQFSVDLYWELNEKYGITSFAEFLSVREFIKRALPEFMEYYHADKSFTTLDAVDESRMCFGKNANERKEFLEFVSMHKSKVLKGRVVLTKDDLRVLAKVLKRAKQNATNPSPTE